MRAFVGLAAGLALALGGCDSGKQELAFENSTLETQCDTLKQETEALKAAVANLKTHLDSRRADNTALNMKVYSLQTENDTLKQLREDDRSSSDARIEQLQKDLATANQLREANRRSSDARSEQLQKDLATAQLPAGGTAFPPTPVPPGDSVAATTAAPPFSWADSTVVAAPAFVSRDPQTVAEAEEILADLDRRIAALRPKIGLANTTISDLTKASIDIRMVPPPDGGICTGCVAFYHQHQGEPMIYNFRGHHIGPAVKRGKFRIQDDKNEAIRTAKAESLPLFQEMNLLQAEQTKVRAKLAKLRAGQ